MLVIVTLAPAITEPAGSVTVPMILPNVACPCRRKETVRNVRKRRKTRNRSRGKSDITNLPDALHDCLYTACDYKSMGTKMTPNTGANVDGWGVGVSV